MQARLAVYWFAARRRMAAVSTEGSIELHILTLVLTALLLTAWAPQSESATGTDPQLTEVVEFLLSSVANADVVFIRNGKKHTPAKAAGHMRRKFEHFRDEIRTAEDFIRLTGTKSLASGKPYLLQLPDGTRVRTADWLQTRLVQYRQSIAADTTSESTES